MAELKSTLVKGNLRVTDDADIKSIKENGVALSDKYLATSGTAADSNKLGGVVASSYVQTVNTKTPTSGAITIGLTAGTTTSTGAVKYVEDTSFDTSTGELVLTTKYLKLN